MGTWIEIPVPREVVKQAIGFAPDHEPCPAVSEHPHITLHHLGKPTFEDVVELVVPRVAAVLQHEELGKFKIELTGHGTFPRGKYTTHFLLANSRTFQSVWRTTECFAGISDKYGFIPHVTLERACELRKAVTFVADVVRIVWKDGDQRRTWDVPL